MTYEYECAAGHPFEVTRSISAEEGDVHCPLCGAKAEQVFSPAAVVFVGGGWARDGYASHAKSVVGK